jgi:hypothetical protein
MNSPHSYFLDLVEPLPQKIQIGRHEYPTLEVCRLLEILCNKAIIKKNNSLRNSWKNCTVEIKVIYPMKPGDRLQVIGKGKTYELISTW